MNILNSSGDETVSLRTSRDQFTEEQQNLSASLEFLQDGFCPVDILGLGEEGLNGVNLSGRDVSMADPSNTRDRLCSPDPFDQKEAMPVRPPLPETYEEATANLSRFSCTIEDIVGGHFEAKLEEEFALLQDYSDKIFASRPRSGVARISYYNTIKSKQYLNKHLNRYSDIVPYDRNAVHVTIKKRSQYTNASKLEINGKAYLCCSAPLPGAFDHFWKMVFESESNNIVMLTNFMENGRVKAHSYWPKMIGKMCEFGTIEVTLKIDETIIENVLKKRTFEVTDGEETREVTHWHFTGWPDFGVANFDEFLTLLEGVRSIKSESPIIGHCSAGVGRLGTFVATFSLLEEIQSMFEADDFQPVNILQRVFELRHQRNLMVQTTEQYGFIYKAIQHFINRDMDRRNAEG
jgi:protein tyrosine phosphatase